MHRFTRHVLVALMTLAFVSPSSARAGGIVAGETDFPIAAIQDVELLPGTPFNMTGTPIFITDLTAVGSFTIIRSAQVGSTIDFTSGDAYFVAASSPIGPFELGAGPTIGIGSYNGSITNVVQNPLDPGYSTGQSSSFVSGDFSASVTQFGLRVGGQLLFTKDAVVFAGPLDGLPSSPGTTLYSSNLVSVYWTNPANGDDLLVGFSFDRRLVSVPEPSSLILAGVGIAAVLGGSMTRRRCSASKRQGE